MNKYFLLYLALLSGCAYVHHTQMGEIVSSEQHTPIPIEVMVSETGFDLQEAGAYSRAVTDRHTANQLRGITGLISLFQMGPRTGAPVWTGDTYADRLYLLLYEKCPSGQLSGLQSTRESNKYPIVSGEIVKVTGYCLTKKTKVMGKDI